MEENIKSPHQSTSSSHFPSACLRAFLLSITRRRVKSIAITLVLFFAAPHIQAQEPIRLLVGNYDEVLEFSVDPSRTEPTLLATTKVTRGQPWPEQFAATRRESELRRTDRQLTALPTGYPSGAKWVEFSPDCKWALVGFDHARFDVMRSITFGRTSPWQRNGEMNLKEFNFILAVAWSPDSRYLLIVETEERYSKSPLALLSGLAGHPVPLETLYLTKIDIQSNKRSRTRFLTDFPYATVATSGVQPKCPAS